VQVQVYTAQVPPGPVLPGASTRSTKRRRLTAAEPGSPTSVELQLYMATVLLDDELPGADGPRHRVPSPVLSEPSPHPQRSRRGVPVLPPSTPVSASSPARPESPTSMEHPTQAQIDEDYRIARAMQATFNEDEGTRVLPAVQKRSLPVEENTSAFVPAKGKRRRLADDSEVPPPKALSAPSKAARRSVPVIDLSSDDELFLNDEPSSDDGSSDVEEESQEVRSVYYCELCEKDCHNSQGMGSHSISKIHRANLEAFCARAALHESATPIPKGSSPAGEAPDFPIAVSDDSVHEVEPTPTVLAKPALTIIRPHLKPAPVVVRPSAKPTLTIIRPYLRPALVVIRPYLKGGLTSRSHPSTK
jgi:hypothetical protein